MLGFAPLSSIAISESGATPDPSGIASAAGPLGAFLCVAFVTVSGIASAESPLGTVFAAGSHYRAIAQVVSPLGEARAVATLTLGALASAASPLGAARVALVHDFSVMLGDTVTHYVMDLTTPGDAVRVPISSWQATLQTGASNYVQCVVPAALDWAASINDATHFTIYRTAQIPDGAAIEYEMARAPLETASYAKGSRNFTCTISGYSTAFAEDEAPPTSYDRTLTGIRSVTIGSGRTRVRCAIDWLLRPGQRAYYDGESSFVTAFINYYVPQGSDAYMDVGD